MNEYQRKRVIEAMDCASCLTEWEHDFIESLAERDEKYPDRPLTEKQNEILNRISQKFL